MANHDGIREMSEQEATVLFELPEVAETAERVRGHFREADTVAAAAEDLRRRAQGKGLEVHAKRQIALATTQAEGGRLATIEANELAAEAQDLAIQATTEALRAERENLKGERAWAELAARHGAYVSHPHRLEIRSREHQGKVFCFDAVEGEMGLHTENRCPQSALRHDHGQREGSDTVMLRRRNSKGKLRLWPGRQGV